MARSSRQRLSPLHRLLRGIVRGLLVALAGYFGLCTLALLLYNVVDPPTTGVQLQRRVASWFSEQPYEKHYRPVPLERIADVLEHAVIAAEDGRFFEHHGIDWQAVREAVEDNRRRGRTWRGGSTITQQLVKNLFMTTHSSYLRKALEVPLAYLAELLLSKERILELYLNVIEWGDGIYGAEAAARHYYGIGAGRLSRHQAAALAAVIPNPRHRHPDRMGWYRDVILRRMQQMGY
ncbi:MAG: monofunctional biosynthetic peptidoglycan transglycosylase [Rhodothermaceae bacterium]|nr:MAG: monofunctional biosynthetic peptidoglycan transglycosylase [Rhodothermaceae bacterium]